MKKIIQTTLILLFFGLAASAQQAGNYSIEVTDKDKEVEGLWATLRNDFEEAIDSAKFENGSVSFGGAADPLGLYTVSFKNQTVFFIPEEAKLTATFKSDEPMLAEGGTLNKELTDVLTIGTRLREKYADDIAALQDEGLSDEARATKISTLSGLIQKESSDLFEAAYNNHLNDGLGALLLRSLVSNMSATEFLAMHQKAGERIKENPTIKRLYEVMLAADATSAGKPFVDVTGVNPFDTKETRHLSEYLGKGNYVIADFWASWCGPCRREMKHLKEIYANYKDKGLEIVGLGVWDELSKNIETIEQMQLPWPQIFDLEENEVAAKYGVLGIPTVILFDKDGTIISRDLRGEELAARIAELLD